MPTHSKLWYFERFRLLDSLNDDQRRLLDQTTRMIEVRRGQRIYLPGDPSDEVFLLKTGVVKIALVTPDRGEVILAFLYPGDIFGELAVVDETPRDHLAQAYEDCLLCAMSRDILVRLIRESPELGFQITKLIGLRIRRLRTRVEELLFKSAAERLAQALLDFSEHYGVADADGIVVPLRLTQGDLGRLVGLSRETVNGILQDWRGKGWIEADRRSIRLRQPDQLRRLA